MRPDDVVVVDLRVDESETESKDPEYRRYVKVVCLTFGFCFDVSYYYSSFNEKDQMSRTPQSRISKTHSSTSHLETQKIASKLLQDMKLKGIVCLYGPMGAGKTTFVKGLAEALSLPEMAIKSPTYTYIREYITPQHSVYHFDLYRLEGKPEVARNMVLEVLEKNPDLLLIEWAENLEKYLPEVRTDIYIQIKDENAREIRVEHITSQNA